MSLRCSLLGHKYGDEELEREREEQGSEVVVTVREFEECERCGTQSVISENTEVTTLQSSAGSPEPAEPSGTGIDTELTGDGHDAEILTDSTESGRATESDDADDAPTSPAAGDDGEPSEPAADDDGVILDDDDEDEANDERQPGEWPDAESTHPAESEETAHADWPEVGREDEGFAAEAGGDGDANVEFGGGLAPESAPDVDESEDVEFVNAEGDTLEAQTAGGDNPELSSGISAGAAAPSFSDRGDDPDVDAEFVCPECDYSAEVSGSSLRAGDICPECARGYLAQE